MLIGHNPGLHDLARQLADTGSIELRLSLAEKFPTAALAILSFEPASWAEIRPGEGRLETFITPKQRA